MTAAAAAALVAGLHARLAADAALAALVGARIHRVVPRNVAFPYLVVETVASSDRSGVAAPLARHTVEIRAFCRDGAPDLALTIAAAAAAALASPPDLTGHRVVLITPGACAARLLKDRLTTEATLTVTVLTEPA
jgi:hypothetical protein